MGEKVTLVFKPHNKLALRIESAFGDNLGPAVLLNLNANCDRLRQRPHSAIATLKQTIHAVDSVYEDYVKSVSLATESMVEEN